MAAVVCPCCSDEKTALTACFVAINSWTGIWRGGAERILTWALKRVVVEELCRRFFYGSTAHLQGIALKTVAVLRACFIKKILRHDGDQPHFVFRLALLPSTRRLLSGLDACRLVI